MQRLSETRLYAADTPVHEPATTEPCAADAPLREAPASVDHPDPSRGAAPRRAAQRAALGADTSTTSPAPEGRNLTTPISNPSTGLIPHNPEKVRAYWTQHLTPEVASLRSPSGDLIYTAPDWLPLTDNELAYLRDHLPPNGRRGTDEEQENLRHLNLHFTHLMVKPPQPEEIRKLHEDAWKNEETWNRTWEQLKKAPKTSPSVFEKAK